MLIKTNSCQTQCVSGASMVSSSVQTNKAHEHHSFPRRDCSNISSEKSWFWATSHWGKCALLRSNQEDSWCHFLLWFWNIQDRPSAFVSWNIKCYNFEVMSARRTTGDWNQEWFCVSRSSAAAPEPYRANISVLWILGTAALSSRCCQSLNCIGVCCQFYTQIRSSLMRIHKQGGYPMFCWTG